MSFSYVWVLGLALDKIYRRLVDSDVEEGYVMDGCKECCLWLGRTIFLTHGPALVCLC